MTVQVQSTRPPRPPLGRGAGCREPWRVGGEAHPSRTRAQQGGALQPAGRAPKQTPPQTRPPPAPRPPRRLPWGRPDFRVLAAPGSSGVEGGSPILAAPRLFSSSRGGRRGPSPLLRPCGEAVRRAAAAARRGEGGDGEKGILLSQLQVADLGPLYFGGQHALHERQVWHLK